MEIYENTRELKLKETKEEYFTIRSFILFVLEYFENLALKNIITISECNGSGYHYIHYLNDKPTLKTMTKIIRQMLNEKFIKKDRSEILTIFRKYNIVQYDLVQVIVDIIHEKLDNYEGPFIHHLLLTRIKGRIADLEKNN